MGLASVVALLVIGEFACVVQSLRFKTFAQLSKLKALSILVNALAAGGDVLIAATLFTILHLSRTGFHKILFSRKMTLDRFLSFRSDTMINKLILFAVNTGLLTSVCAVASLISIVVAGNTFLYIAFFFCIWRLYTNSLLATLNARKMIRIAGEGTQTTSENLSVSLREFPKNGPMSTIRPTNMSIKTNTTKEFATDSDQELDLVKSQDIPTLFQKIVERSPKNQRVNPCRLILIRLPRYSRA